MGALHKWLRQETDNLKVVSSNSSTWGSRCIFLNPLLIVKLCNFKRPGGHIFKNQQQAAGKYVSLKLGHSWPIFQNFVFSKPTATGCWKRSLNRLSHNNFPGLYDHWSDFCCLGHLKTSLHYSSGS